MAIDKRPPVLCRSFAFRIMVGIALIMLFVVIAGQILRLRGRLWDSVWSCGCAHGWHRSGLSRSSRLDRN